MRDSEIRQLVEDYREHAIPLGLLESRLLDLDISEETDLSRRLVGLLAEASHAHWSEDGICQELESAVRPFAFVFHINEPSLLPDKLSLELPPSPPSPNPTKHLSNEKEFGMQSENSPIELAFCA